MKRNGFLDYAKGVLIVLVMIGHAVQFTMYQDKDFWDDPLLKAIYLFHMPLFMGLSGYLSWSGLQKGHFGPYALNKLKAYILPVFSWAVLYCLIAFAIQGGGVTAATALPGAIVDKATTTLWFLWALCSCLLITAAIKTVGRAFWTLVALAFAGMLLLPEGPNFTTLKFMFPYFMVGYALAESKITPLRRETSIVLFTLACLVTILCYNLWQKDSYIYTTGMILKRWNINNCALRYTAGFFGSISAFFTLRFIYKLSPDSFRRPVEILGQDSIYVYILQGNLFAALLHLARQLSLPVITGLTSSLLSIAEGIAMAALCWFVGRVLNKSALLGLLLFGRSKKRPTPPAPVLQIQPTRAQPAEIET